MPFVWQISAGITKGPSGLAPLCYTRSRVRGSLDLIPPCCGGSLMSLVSGGVRLGLHPAGPPCIRGIGPSFAVLLPPSWTVGTPSFRPPPPPPQRRGTERVRNTCASVRPSVCRADRPSPVDAAWGVHRRGERGSRGGRAQPVGRSLARSRSHCRRRLLTQSMNM